MANIYVGFHDQRNSSRVLKPPGGGSSDIFGISPIVSDDEVKSVPNTPTKDNVDAKNQNAEVKSDSNKVDNTKQEEVSNSEEPKIENLSIKEENGEKPLDRPSDPKLTPTKPDSISGIIRQNDPVEAVQSPVAEPEKKTPQRVPPGGYSSGLW